MKKIPKHKLIVTVVRRGCCETIIEASRQAGAEGATIIHGRGTGVHEQKKLLGIPIEPEKDIILIIIKETLAEQVLQAIIDAGKLNQPATGIAFIIDLDQVVGIVHLLKELENNNPK